MGLGELGEQEPVAFFNSLTISVQISQLKVPKNGFGALKNEGVALVYLARGFALHCEKSKKKHVKKIYI